MRVMWTQENNEQWKHGKDDASKSTSQGQVYAHGIGHQGHGVSLHPPLPAPFGHALGNTGLGAGLHDLGPGLVLVKGAAGVAAPPVIDVPHQLQPMSTNIF